MRPIEPKEPKEVVVSDDPVEQAFTEKVKGRIKRNDFRALETLGRGLVKTKERFKGGIWKIFCFDRLVASPIADNPDNAAWESHIKLLQEWTEAMPKSIFARTALANAYFGYAWVARGQGYADSISRENRSIFEERIEKAVAAAEAASLLEARYQGYFDLLLSVGTVQGWDRKSFEAAFDEAVKFEPTYQYFYTRKAVYLLPRWSGEPGDWEAFAERIKADLGTKAGLKMYFLIVIEIGGYHSGNFFQTNNVSWEDTKKGFELYEMEFGMNRRKLNQFGLLARHASDAQAACSVFGRLQGENDFEPEVWDSRKVFESYRRISLALCKVPKFNNQAK